jgi:hypothetical protein
MASESWCSVVVLCHISEQFTDRTWRLSHSKHLSLRSGSERSSFLRTQTFQSYGMPRGTYGYFLNFYARRKARIFSHHTISNRNPSSLSVFERFLPRLAYRPLATSPASRPDNADGPAVKPVTDYCCSRFRRRCFAQGSAPWPHACARNPTRGLTKTTLVSDLSLWLGCPNRVFPRCGTARTSAPSVAHSPLQMACGGQESTRRLFCEPVWDGPPHWNHQRRSGS